MSDVDMDSLREIHFAGCDPAFFPDDEEDLSEMRKELEALSEAIDQASILAGNFYKDHKCWRSMKINEEIMHAHCRVISWMEDI